METSKDCMCATNTGVQQLLKIQRILRCLSRVLVFLCVCVCECGYVCRYTLFRVAYMSATTVESSNPLHFWQAQIFQCLYTCVCGPNKYVHICGCITTLVVVQSKLAMPTRVSAAAFEYFMLKVS